jgi:hypothetical protein
MSFEPFLHKDYYLIRLRSDESDNSKLQEILSSYDLHLKQSESLNYYLGIPADLDENKIQARDNWIKDHQEVETFFYFHLDAHQKIEDIITDNSKISNKKLHILPSQELNYGRFKDELWDLHLDGFQVYFHHVNEVKSFAKNLDLFQKLSNRGVLVGVTATWSPTWLGNNIIKIREMIQDLNIHFFNTECIEIQSDLYQKEQAIKSKIISADL